MLSTILGALTGFGGTAITGAIDYFKDKKIKYTGINIKENTNLLPKYDKQTIYIISADFSHINADVTQSFAEADTVIIP